MGLSHLNLGLVAAGQGLGLAVALGASNTLETLTVNQYFHMLFRVALHLKASSGVYNLAQLQYCIQDFSALMQ